MFIRKPDRKRVSQRRIHLLRTTLKKIGIFKFIINVRSTFYSPNKRDHPREKEQRLSVRVRRLNKRCSKEI